MLGFEIELVLELLELLFIKIVEIYHLLLLIHVLFLFYELLVIGAVSIYMLNVISTVFFDFFVLMLGSSTSLYQWLTHAVKVLIVVQHVLVDLFQEVRVRCEIQRLLLLTVRGFGLRGTELRGLNVSSGWDTLILFIGVFRYVIAIKVRLCVHHGRSHTTVIQTRGDDEGGH